MCKRCFLCLFLYIFSISQIYGSEINTEEFLTSCYHKQTIDLKGKDLSKVSFNSLSKILSKKAFKNLEEIDLSKSTLKTEDLKKLGNVPFKSPSDSQEGFFKL